jgi:RNase H-fold protein (predicted Holliday junction resolvase)
VTSGVFDPAVVLALDPGRAKCGIAVVEKASPPGDKPRVLHREIVETARVVARVLPLVTLHGVATVLVGNATGGHALARALRDALPEGFPVHLVEEAFSSQRARNRYLQEHQPRGWQRLVPPGLRLPPVPVDDYAALLLAEDFFVQRGRVQ